MPSRLNRRSLAALVAFGMCVLTLGTVQAADLSERLQPLIDAHQGKVAVAIKHLRSNETFLHQADQPMPTASLIKFPVMIAAYQAIADGRARPDQPITLKDEDKVPGSGILTTHFSAGTVVSLRDAIRLMIAYSDNTATNLVVDQIGLPATAALMGQLGLPNTRLHSQVYRRDTSIFPERSQQFGLGSTTAAEMLDLYERLSAGQLVNAAACEEMLAHLHACEDEKRFRRFLPKAKIAHKTGAVDAVRCDAGIIDSPSGPFIVCVLTSDNTDRSWGNENAAELLCARVAEAAYQHFNPPPAPKPAAVSNDGPLQLGSQGPLVEGLQRTLNARMQPSPQLGVDGDFGPVTRDAVVRFQESKELEATGIVTPETWAALGPIVDANEPESDAPAPVVKAAADAITGRPFVTCKAWAIVDGETGELIDGEQADEPLHNASTTKMMTAYLVVRYTAEHPEVLDEIVTFSARADNTTGSTAAIRTGERLPVRDLMYGLLLPSGNDASVALAEHFGARLAGRPDERDPAIAYDLFVEQMNAAAAELGMTATHYKNPHGLSVKGHSSSAHDLIKLARVALQLPLFEQVVNTSRHECLVVGFAGYQRKLVWKNTNRLLEIEGFDGVKTGTTTLAGACLVSRGRRDGRSLLVAVLGSAASDSRYTDTRNLYRWGWEQLGTTSQP